MFTLLFFFLFCYEFVLCLGTYTGIIFMKQEKVVEFLVVRHCLTVIPIRLLIASSLLIITQFKIFHQKVTWL